MLLDTRGKRAPTVELTMTGPGGYRATGRFAGYAPSDASLVMTRLSQAPPQAADGQLCLHNTGRRAIGLVGTGEPESVTLAGDLRWRQASWRGRPGHHVPLRQAALARAAGGHDPRPGRPVHRRRSRAGSCGRSRCSSPRLAAWRGVGLAAVRSQRVAACCTACRPPVGYASRGSGWPRVPPQPLGGLSRCNARDRVRSPHASLCSQRYETLATWRSCLPTTRRTPWPTSSERCTGGARVRRHRRRRRLDRRHRHVRRGRRCQGAPPSVQPWDRWRRPGGLHLRPGARIRLHGPGGRRRPARSGRDRNAPDRHGGEPRRST